jgi:phosphoglycolate phosphatase
LFDGVMPLLTQLSEQGALLAVATGKSRLGLNRVLAQTGLGDYFVATRCADETASKPHPLMLHELLAHTGIALDDAVMIGDTSYDMEMAQQIAMPRIGVSYGVHSVDVLQSYQPLAIVDSIYQLQEFLC